MAQQVLQKRQRTLTPRTHQEAQRSASAFRSGGPDDHLGALRKRMQHDELFKNEVLAV